MNVNTVLAQVSLKSGDVPDTQATILWVGCAAMVLGALAIAALGQSARDEDKHHSVVAAFVPLIAAVAYFAMATGQGDLVVDGRTVFFARYVDWVFTTPLLLIGLLTIGLPVLRGAVDDGRQRTGLVAGVVGADVLMIVTGLFAALSSDDTNRYTWYTISCGAFLAVIAIIWGPVRQAARAQGGSTFVLYGQLLAVLTVLWFIYPVLWILGTEGSGTIGLSAEVLVFAVIDVVAKVGFGLLLVGGIRRLASRTSTSAGRTSVEGAGSVGTAPAR